MELEATRTLHKEKKLLEEACQGRGTNYQVLGKYKSWKLSRYVP